MNINQHQFKSFSTNIPHKLHRNYFADCLPLVWEALDTEEATYIWHIEESAYELERNIKRIDGLLGQIRTKGRQQYLETNAEHFSRILYDYSDETKGLIIWKDVLEEKLF